MRMPGFTSEASLGAATRQYHGKGYFGARDQEILLPQIFGLPVPYPGLYNGYPVFHTVCDYSTGKLWCYGISRYTGLGTYQECGICGPNTGGSGATSFM